MRYNDWSVSDIYSLALLVCTSVNLCPLLLASTVSMSSRRCGVSALGAGKSPMREQYLMSNTVEMYLFPVLGGLRSPHMSLLSAAPTGEVFVLGW